MEISGGAKNDTVPERAWICTTCLQWWAENPGRHTHPRGGECPSFPVKAGPSGLPPNGIQRTEISDVEYDRLLAAHVEAVGISPPSAAFREWTRFDFSKCRHVEERIVEIENEHGKWGMAICIRCAHVNTVECPHVKNEWRLDGKILVCENCGADGT